MRVLTVDFQIDQLRNQAQEAKSFQTDERRHPKEVKILLYVLLVTLQVQSAASNTIIRTSTSTSAS